MKPIPEYIYKKKNQIIMTLFVPLFSLVFIYMYKPDDVNIDIKKLSFGLPVTEVTAWHVIVLIMVLIGMFVIALNRLWMNKIVKNKPISYIKYILWVSAEIILMALIYGTVSSFISDKSIFTVMNDMFGKVLRILLIPYVMCYIYFIMQEKAQQLNAIKKQIQEEEEVQKNAYIQIVDEKGKLQMSVRRENLLFIESADNYVMVWYLNNDVPKKVMIRNTLKNMVELLGDTNVKRCHRSYMINMDHIKVLRREKEGIFIEMGIEAVPDIPISKTYADSIKQWIMNN